MFQPEPGAADQHPRHEDFTTRHAPTPPELPLRDGEASTNVDLKTQIVRFVITGAGSGVLDFGLTLFLQYIVGTPFWIAKSLGFVLGTTTAYLLNRRWTFEAEPSALRFVGVAALYAVTFFVNVGLYTWLSHLWPEEVLFSFVAYVIAQGTATVINFVVQRLVIFRIR
ncbi:GtrA family protein [Gordonia rhizosphera]|uniref:GtrA/DPMS transmembrane domain-containing protein n=1 Tax=Gordonia rhizosphera NBRC 16068 TaxID=1108045 RepID=K6WIA2_9ACTN|nr:GtrA family protein [Gordonia rhizosphera]GAB91872.1 hypothetical protein GORHZ_151_00440 [Gordonia rhizosphera NBRC 16068]